MPKDPNKLTTSKKGERLSIAAGIYVTEVYVKHTPKYSWLQALKDAGYSISYANARLADLWVKAETWIAEQKEKLIIKAEWDLIWLDQEFKDLYQECRSMSDKTNAKGCLDSMSRRLSGFTDNINDNREKQDKLPAADQAILAEHLERAKIALSKPKEAI